MKYLAGEMRTAFGYEGCPLVLVPKARPKTIDSVRRFKRQPFASDRNLRHGRESHRKATAKPVVKKKSPGPVAAELPPRLRKGRNRSSVKPGQKMKRR